MSKRTQRQPGPVHTESPVQGAARLQLSLKSGIEAWFDVDDITIHVWGSSWTGREVITVCQGGHEHVASSKRSWRLRSPHAFEHDGKQYLVVLGVGLAGVTVELYRDGVLIDSDQINKSGFRIDPATGKLDWKYALKSLALPLLAGLVVGSGFGYLAGVALR